MNEYFVYKEINETEGAFHITDVSFPALMKKHKSKHATSLQPIYEAISNSFEATKDENDKGVYGGEKRSPAKIRYEVYHYSTLLERAILRNKIFTDKISVNSNYDGNGLPESVDHK